MVEAWYVEASANSLILKEKTVLSDFQSSLFLYYYRLENMEKMKISWKCMENKKSSIVVSRKNCKTNFFPNFQTRIYDENGGNLFYPEIYDVIS